MSNEFDAGLPSIRQIQMLIRDQQTIKIKLLTGDELEGKLRWQDPNAICIEVEGQSLMLMRPAIAYLRLNQ